MKILLVEDEPLIANVIRQGLEQSRYHVEVADSGIEGQYRAEQNPYALIILDLMLPGRDGLTVCCELRAQRITTPILMLTARDTVLDKVRGLDVGADDYLPKPFDFTELLARVNALMRRERIHKSQVIKVADLEIDTGQRRVLRAGREVSLTPREYSLLEALASREGQVLTREVIQERVWLDEDSFSNTVDVYIGTLRKKIDAGQETKLIQTVHGIGYTLRRPAEPVRS